MQIQSNLASTIAMAFDECIKLPAEYSYVKPSCDRTYRWLVRCKAEMARLNALPDRNNPHQMLFGINQGGTYEAVSYTHLLDSSTATAVSLLPAPATTGTRPATFFTV